MIHQVVFFETLRELERSGAESEWRETLAGLLVLRLYHLWELDPGVAQCNTRVALRVRALVESLPESATAKDHLLALLDTLGEADAPTPQMVAAALGCYARALAERARLPLARDVCRVARLGWPGGSNPTAQ